MRTILKYIIIVNLSIFAGSAGMFFNLKNQIQPIKDFGECLESKVEGTGSASFTPINAPTECYLENIK